MHAIQTATITQVKDYMSEKKDEADKVTRERRLMTRIKKTTRKEVAEADAVPVTALEDEADADPALNTSGTKTVIIYEEIEA